MRRIGTYATTLLLILQLRSPAFAESPLWEPASPPTSAGLGSGAARFWRKPKALSPRNQRRLEQIEVLAARLGAEDITPLQSRTIATLILVEITALGRSVGRDANLSYLEAASAYWAEDYERSLSAVARAIELDPKHPRLRSLLLIASIARAKTGSDAEQIPNDYAQFLAEPGEVEALPMALQVGYREGRTALALANFAESWMAVGDLDRAIATYQAAITGYFGATSARYGLAVAYDRAERDGDCRAMMAKALASDREFEALLGPGVFFVPEGDVHYYLALAHEVRGDFESARQAWQRFLLALPNSPWAARARVHLERLAQPAKPQ